LLERSCWWTQWLVRGNVASVGLTGEGQALRTALGPLMSVIDHGKGKTFVGDKEGFHVLSPQVARKGFQDLETTGSSCDNDSNMVYKGQERVEGDAQDLQLLAECHKDTVE
jgi:hypothetical protein